MFGATRCPREVEQERRERQADSTFEDLRTESVIFCKLSL